MKEYKTILFDADDTVLDFRKGEKIAFLSATAEHGYEFKDEHFQRYMRLNDSLWRQFEQGDTTKKYIEENRFLLFFREIGLESHSALGLGERYRVHLSQQSQLIDDAEEVCRILSEFTSLYIVTNGIYAIQKHRIEKAIIWPYFERIFVSEEIGYQKPNREFFDYVLNAIGNPSPQSVLVVGDSLTSDIQGAINGGLDSCWFNPHQSRASVTLPITYQIHTLRELLPIVLGERYDCAGSWKEAEG